MSNDKILTAIAFDGMIRITAAITTDTVGKAADIHKMPPTSAAALGRLLTGAGLMSNMLKNDGDKLTLQIKGNGPIGGLVVTGDRSANVKGYADNPECDLPIRNDGKLDVSGAIGKGYLQVIKDIGLKEPYTGMVNLISGEIAEDLAYYFAVSEQINTAIGLGVLINPDCSISKAGGYILQVMPGASEECISYLEKRLTELPSVVALINEDADCEELVKNIFENHDVKFLDTGSCRYQCNCSRERMERNLISIGEEDLMDLAKDPETELVCHFCNSRYIFTPNEILNLVKNIKK